MQDKIYDEIRDLIAEYIEIPKDELSMDADLDIEYDMDSTEMTELAKNIEQKYTISIAKSERQNWVSARSICSFVAQKLLAEKAIA